MLMPTFLLYIRMVVNAKCLFRNVEFYFEKPFMILTALCMAAFLAGILKSRSQLADVCIDIIPFLLVAVMPFVWYARCDHSGG